MIFTDRFVYVHVPETGSTFVTTVLDQIHSAETVETRTRFHTRPVMLWKEKIARGGRHGTYIYSNNKHGTCHQIPPEHRDKPIVATIRNPFDWYVSQYRFGWWKREQYLPFFRSVPDFALRYPHFPEVSFAEYMTLSLEAFGGFLGPLSRQLPRWIEVKLGLSHRRRVAEMIGVSHVGLYTQQFLKYFARKPGRVLANLALYGDPERFWADLYKVRFIRTARLNQALHAFLLEMGYAAEDVNFVLTHGRVLPFGQGRGEQEGWEIYFTPELIEQVRRSDRLVLSAFPELDIARVPASGATSQAPAPPAAGTPM